MRLRLSFRNKIILTIVLTVGGFASLGAVSAPTLKQMADAVSRAAALARAANTVTDLQIQALDLMEGARRLADGEADAFARRLEAVTSRNRVALERAREAAGDPRVAEALAGVWETYRGYAGTLEEWVRRKERVGTAGASGLRGAVDAAGDRAVEALSWMSVLRNPLLEARDHLKSFFMTRDPGSADRFREKIGVVREKISALGMENAAAPGGDRVSDILDAYTAAADRAIGESLAKWETEARLLAALDRVKASAGKARSVSQSVLDQARAGVLDSGRRTRLVLTAGGGAVAVVLVALLGWIGVTTVKRLNRTADTLKDMALGDGDLTRKLPQRFVVCSDIMGCDDAQCPSHGVADPCWTQVGSLQLGAETHRCRQLADGTVASCEHCDVYGATRALEADEFDRMAHWFNLFVDRVRHVVRRVGEASDELVGISGELSSATSQIASANEQVAAQSQAVATGGEQMTATVQEVAGNTGLVRAAAEAARTSATEGSAVVSRALDAMRDIARVVEEAATTVRGLGERSDQIGTVIQVIEDIADQTNLLALNAAIEAARAGEHGRGFAVVADEVRKLAEKTVRATREIGETVASIQAETRRAVEAIDQGIGSVRKGRELGEKAGGAIQEIEGQVSRAAGQTHQIAVATEELSATVQEVAANMDQIARGVAQNTDAAAQLARTAEAVAAKAEGLQRLTSSFQT